MHVKNNLIRNVTIHPDVILNAFILLDILIFPVSPFFSVPYSLPFILYLSLKFFRVKIPSHKKIFFSVFVFTLFLSTIFSLVFKEKVVIIDNGISTFVLDAQKEDLKRFIYFIFAILLYRITYISQSKMTENIWRVVEKILFLVCIVFLVMGIIFIVDVNSFYHLKSIFFNADVDMTSNIILNASGYLKRFNFILLDPNNASYLILIITIFLLENFKIGTFKKIFTWFIMIFSLILTRSLGGAYSLLIYFILKIFSIPYSKLNIKKLLVFFTVLLVTMCIIAFGSLNDKNIIRTIIQSEVFQRWTSNNLTGRTQIYKEIIEELPPLIGNGYTLVKNNLYVSPHSDHLRIIYSYGIIAYLSLIIFTLRKKFLVREYLFMIPAFIAFSINTLIDEPRLLYTFIILLATANAKKDLNSFISSNKLSKSSINFDI